MGKNPDKNKTEQEISEAIEALRQRALVITEVWGRVLDVAHQQQGKLINKRFITALQGRVSATFENAEPNGRWVVSRCEGSTITYSVNVWFSGPGAGRMGRPSFSDAFRFRIGDYSRLGPPQITVDVDYIKRENKWHAAEDEKAALCSQALSQGKPKEWADKIKAIDEAQQALLADAQAFGISYLLDV
jgi:hypothetical protein